MLKPKLQHRSVGAAAVIECGSGDCEDPHYGHIALHGIGVGILTGVVGVGGGFLIVPALVLLSGLSMKRAVKNLSTQPDFLLIDGKFTLDMDIQQAAIVKGDAKSISIAAASIIAKVTRDAIMKELHDTYPQYNFARHKGYPTRAHKEAILNHGPCPYHRLTFKGVKEVINEK
jgi:hypothetical protein